MTWREEVGPEGRMGPFGAEKRPPVDAGMVA